MHACTESLRQNITTAMKGAENVCRVIVRKARIAESRGDGSSIPFSVGCLVIAIAAIASLVAGLVAGSTWLSCRVRTGIGPPSHQGAGFRGEIGHQRTSWEVTGSVFDSAPTCTQTRAESGSPWPDSVRDSRAEEVQLEALPRELQQWMSITTAVAATAIEEPKPLHFQLASFWRLDVLRRTNQNFLPLAQRFSHCQGRRATQGLVPISQLCSPELWKEMGNLPLKTCSRSKQKEKVKNSPKDHRRQGNTAPLWSHQRLRLVSMGRFLRWDQPLRGFQTRHGAKCGIHQREKAGRTSWRIPALLKKLTPSSRPFPLPQLSEKIKNDTGNSLLRFRFDGWTWWLTYLPVGFCFGHGSGLKFNGSIPNFNFVGLLSHIPLAIRPCVGSYVFGSMKGKTGLAYEVWCCPCVGALYQALVSLIL